MAADILLYDAHSRGALAYLQLASELLTRLLIADLRGLGMHESITDVPVVTPTG